MRTTSLKLWAPIGAMCVVFWWTFLLTGCKSTPSSPESQGQFAEVPGITTPPRNAAAALPASNAVPVNPVTNPGGSIDFIRTGDLLTITYTDLPFLQPPNEERVKGDGTITLLQNQTFVAAGKTHGQLEKEIRERYVPRFFVSMTVSVKPQTQTQFYFVGGEVRSPGRQVYIGRMTVTRAIQSAGDFTDFANKKKVRLTRITGKLEIINCVKALDNPALDPELFPGDKIHVPRKIF